MLSPLCGCWYLRVSFFTGSRFNPLFLPLMKEAQFSLIFTINIYIFLHSRFNSLSFIMFTSLFFIVLYTLVWFCQIILAISCTCGSWVYTRPWGRTLKHLSSLALNCCRQCHLTPSFRHDESFSRLWLGNQKPGNIFIIAKFCPVPNDTLPHVILCQA